MSIRARLRIPVKRTWAEDRLREADERYRSLIETLPLATYMDVPGNTSGVVYVSPQIEEMTGYPQEEWTADTGLFRRILHPDDRARVIGELDRVKASGEPLDHEYRLVRRDGSIVWVHDSAVTTWVDGTQYNRGFIVDVTARREAERERQQQNERLRELDRLKDEFIALVSHELRTPLTSIRGYLDLLTEDLALTDEHRHHLATIDRNAHRLERVVGDLLFFAQVEAGQLTLNAVPLDLNAVVEDAVHAAQPAVEARSVTLTTQLDDLPEIAGDRARLAQVLDNFVSNAVKFTPPGGSVRVTTQLEDGEVEVRIADTGIGISAEELPQLFQRFFRTKRATVEAIPGTGLGLAISRAIVLGHGGRVEVESEENVGTTFRIVLPVAR